MSDKNEIAELRIKAGENLKKQTQERKEKYCEMFHDSQKHNEETQEILNRVGAAVGKRKAEDYKTKLNLEAEKTKEQERIDDIKRNGSNDYNDKEHRDSMRKLISGLPKSADRTKQILSTN